VTLLTIVDNAADRIGVVRPTAVVASTDQQVLRLLGYANQEGKDLAQRVDWKVLTAEKTFTTTAAAVQASAIPSDFDRMIDQSFFNRTRKRRVEGPISAEDWQYTQAVVATTLVSSFRIRGTDLLMTPTPSAGDTCAYEYVSKNWCQSSLAVGQTVWTADTDTGILDEELMTLGIIWRFKKGQGLSYDEDFRSYELKLAQLAARDGGKPRLNAGYRRISGPRMPTIQEGSWSL
jgi:hypothetical protein